MLLRGGLKTAASIIVRLGNNALGYCATALFENANHEIYVENGEFNGVAV